MINKRLINTGVEAAPAAGLDPLQNFETVTYTGNGSTQKITGHIRKGAAFNGSSSYIQSTSLGSQFAGNNTLSISLWFRSTTDSHQSLVNFSATGDASTEMGLRIRGDVTGDQIGIFNRNNGTYNIEANNTGTGSVIDGDWHHVVLTGDSSGHKLYFDGSELTSIVYQTGSSSTTLSVPSDINSFSIGANIDSSGAETFLNGQIDQVRIFNTALNSTQVGELALETYADPKKSTTDYFGNGSGVALYELDEDAKDTGDTYNGTPTNVNFLGMAFQPDLVWIKRRDSGIGDTNHLIFDSVRGAGERLSSDNTNQEYTLTDEVTSFDSNGFTVGADASTNGSGGSIVAWCWKAGGAANTYNVLEGGTVTSDSTASGAGITAGTITNGWEVSANRDAGFSIVKYQANSTQGATIGHGLSSAPEMIITKEFTGPRVWCVYHKDLTNSGYYLELNTTNSELNSLNTAYAGVPTSSTYSIGNSSVVNNPSTDSYIAYCFHSVDGYQKVGSYLGTGTTNSFTGFGFQPRWIMIRRSDGTGDWWVFDSLRGNNKGIRPNLSGTEDTTDADANTNEYRINFLPDGFQYEIDDSTNASPSLNELDGTYIYLAIA